MKVIPIIYLPIHTLYLSGKKGIRQALTHLLNRLACPFHVDDGSTDLFWLDPSKAAIIIFSQTQRTGEVLTYWNLSALLNEVFSFPLVRYLWVLGLMVGYLLYHQLQKDSSEPNSLSLLLKGYLFATIGFLLTRTFIPEQFVIHLTP